MATLDEILELINSKDLADKRIGLEELSDLNSLEHKAYFIDYFRHQNVAIREVCVDYFIKMKSSEFFPDLVDVLNCEDVPLRNAAFQVLMTISHHDPSRVISYLWKINDDVDKFLLDSINDNHDLKSLDQEQCRAVSQGLNSNNENLVGVVVEILTKLGDQQVWYDIIEKAATAAGWIQYSILKCGKLYNPEIIELFFDMVPEELVSEEAKMFCEVWQGEEAS